MAEHNEMPPQPHSQVDYEQIGLGYAAKRQTDPVLAAAIWRALGDADSVLNVGAGSGSYEPPGRRVVAVEPSAVMIAQRPAGAAPVVRAAAESLPFDDNSFDAVLAVLSDHHWRDRQRALVELRRVAKLRVVIFNADPAQARRFWLTQEYLPGFLDLIPPVFARPGAWRDAFAPELGPRVAFEPVAIPHDCRDGFYGSFWRRPRAYLDPGVRAAISVFARIEASAVDSAIRRLRADLDSGAWHMRHADLLARDSLDLGYMIVSADVGKAICIDSYIHGR